LRIAIERRLDLDFRSLIAQAVESAATDIARVAVERSQPAPATDVTKLNDDVYEYVFDRLRAYYLEGNPGFGVTPEMFDAVLATRPGSPLDFDAKLRALGEFLSLPDATSLAAANKRIANILRKATEPVGDHVDPALLRDPAEQVLGEQVAAMAKQVEPRFAAREYTQALRQLAALRKAVDDFFDSVMVMADDAQLRQNRLALLKRMQGLFMHVADLSRLPG
jgi:glycyl-tRNA synthetase beta chain